MYHESQKQKKQRKINSKKLERDLQHGIEKY
jgi:hypothetical protein